MKRLSASLLLIAALTAGLAPSASAHRAAFPAGDLPNAQGAPFNPVAIDAHKTRIFLPLHHVTIRKQDAKIGSWQMELTGTGLGTCSLERGIDRGALHYLRIQSFEGRTYIHADWRYAAPVHVTVGRAGIQIVFEHRLAPAVFHPVAPGVAYWEGQRWNGAGPMRVRALKLDPHEIQLETAVATPGAAHMGLAPVSRIAWAHGAIAAVNGGYFSPRTGEPQGEVIAHHELISRTMCDRPAFWVERDGSAYVKMKKPYAEIATEDGGTLRCQAVNEQARRDRVTLYTDEFGPSTRTIPDPSRWEFAITGNGLVVDQGYGNLPIPKGGVVVSGQGKGYVRLRDVLGYGQHVHVKYSFGDDVVAAVGGGPTLLHDGRFQTPQTHYAPDIVFGRAPRTAIGITGDGHYLMVCVDGRRPGYSVGATIKELAATLRSLGAKEALNLDGGGSTTMWLRGHVLNRPSDGSERSVSTALLAVPRNRAVASALTNLLADR
ncbi:MAG TPA: phosphodiester glycosidase family protein [Oscillatoriaceae cyanobacterium]